MIMNNRRGTDVSTGTTSTTTHKSEEYASVEYGLTGDEQPDESYYDERLLFEDEKESNINDDDDDDNTNEGITDDNGGGGGAGMGRIQFSTKKLYGRDTELARINQILQRVANDDNPSKGRRNNEDSSDIVDDDFQSQVIFLSGYSGCGKTSLVQEAVKIFSNSNSNNGDDDDALDLDFHPRFISSKYEEQQAPVSYKGISDAFSQLMLSRERMSSTETRENVHSIRSRMEEAGLEEEDLNVLVEIIPALERVLLTTDGVEDIDMQSKSTHSTTPSSSILKGLTPDSTINKSRLHNIFRCFLRIICKDKDSTIILFIDDLQWADIETLDVLESILTDSSIQHLCFIGSYRSNEVESTPSSSSEESQDKDQQHPLSTCIQKIQSQRRIETMELTDLSKPCVGEFLADTLHLHIKDVAPLTDAIYSKALGNIFFTKQALEQLVRGNALYYDMMIFQWQWVLTTDQLEDQLSNDIVEMVKTKIEHMPPEVQSTLTVAANTTSKFDTDTLLDVLSNSEEQSVDKKSLLNSLDIAVAEGLLVHSSGTDIYAFAHDRVREAARTFCSGEELELLLYNIGNALAKRGSDDAVGEDWMLLTAIHLLNSIPRSYHDEDGIIYLAKLNLDAATLSMTRAAFEKAFEYSRKGIECLPSNRWEKYRSLCQGLYAAAAESSRLLGNIVQMERYCTIALMAQRDRPMDEKFQILFTMAIGIFYLGDQSDKAKEILLTLLDHLGCRFPRSRTMTTSRTIFKLIALIVTKKRRTSSELDATELMTDTKKIETMKLLDKLFDVCYITRDEVLLPLVIFRALDYTLKYGLSIYSPRLVASVCIIFMGAVNDVEGSGLYANYALELLKRVEHKPIVSGTVFFAYMFGMNWILPIRDCIPPLREAYRIGTINGDVENSLWSKYHSIFYTFQAGRPLSSINSDCRICVPIMQKKGRGIIIIFTVALWRTTLRLMGRDHDVEKVAPLNLSENESQTTMSHSLLIGSIERIEKGYNGEYSLCADSAFKGCERFRKAFPGNPISPMDMFVSAVSCFEMFRRTKKAAYKKEAMRLKKWICSWAKQGNPNTHHWRSLLEAEFAFLKGKNTEADKHYTSAVELATKGGYMHDAALAYERWGMYAISQRNDKSMAISKLQESQRLFKGWGASGRVEQLENAIQDIGVD